MCGPFKSCQGILRLLEIIFSALAFILVIFRGVMVSPWGVWCEFVWFFCICVPVVLTVMEAKSWQILLAAFLPDWADLTCGLTLLCGMMIISATIIYGVVFVYFASVVSILCLIASLIATVVFLVDGVMEKMKCPSGYMCSLRGNLRITESFIACIILTAATDHFVFAPWYFRPYVMLCSSFLIAICLIITVLIIVLNLLTKLLCLQCIKLNMMEFLFNIVAVLAYLLAILIWCIFGYKRYNYNPYICVRCNFADMNTVTIGAIVNLVFYLVDLFLSFKSR